MTMAMAPQVREALAQVAQFPLLDALYGRRSRRFALGAEIPDGPLAYRSAYEPLPLTELERMLVLSSMTGTTGWHYAITRNAHYAPHLSSYSGAAAGRTFPSAAGFHTAELFFTDDSGTYFLPTRDGGALIDPAEEELTPELMVERHAGQDPPAVRQPAFHSGARALHGGAQHLVCQRPRVAARRPGWPTSPSTCCSSCASSCRTATACTTTSTTATCPASSSSVAWSTSTRRTR